MVLMSLLTPAWRRQPCVDIVYRLTSIFTIDSMRTIILQTCLRVDTRRAGRHKPLSGRALRPPRVSTAMCRRCLHCLRLAPDLHHHCRADIVLATCVDISRGEAFDRINAPRSPAPPSNRVRRSKPATDSSACRSPARTAGRHLFFSRMFYRRMTHYVNRHIVFTILYSYIL